MATVNIKLSQNVIDQQHALETRGTNYDTIGGVVGNFNTAGYGIDTNADFLSWNLANSTLEVDYTKGVTETYIGFRPDNAAASSGHASATAYNLHQTGVATVSAIGSLNFDYVLGSGNNASLETSAQGHFLNSLRVATEYASSSPGYDQIFGNVKFDMSGRLSLGADGAIGGLINTITVQADKLLRSSTIEGRFFMDSAQPTGVSGLLSSYYEDYYDGSMTSLNGTFEVNANADLGAVYNNAANFGGADIISVDLPGRLYTQSTVRAGNGDDQITLKGGGGMLGADAGAGNDIIKLLDNAHAVDGGAGLDTVQLTGTRSAYAVLKGSTAGSFTVTDRDGVVLQLTNVERIAFADTSYALDIDGNGGQAYRIYQAAFARTPDSAGLGFWMNSIDHGANMTDVAQGFINSQEYQSVYGLVSNNRELVTKYYANILHRAPEAAGLAYWTDVLDHKAASVAQVLADISESAENRDGVAMLIGNGFEYTPYA